MLITKLHCQEHAILNCSVELKLILLIFCMVGVAMVQLRYKVTFVMNAFEMRSKCIQDGSNTLHNGCNANNSCALFPMSQTHPRHD